MDFNSFVCSLIIAFIRHDFMRDEITAAGINLGEMPDSVFGKDVFDKYIAKRQSKSEQLAEFELERELSILERFAGPLSEIPRKPEILRDKFQDLFSAHQFEQLGKELKANPESGKDLIESFQLKRADSVQYQSLEELSILVGIHKASASEGRAKVIVPGFERLSEMIGGFNGERIGIFLGETGFGKTNFAVNLALKAAENMVVLNVNQEMGYSDMVTRYAVIGSGVSYSDYLRGNFQQGRVEQALKTFGHNIFITSGRGLSFEQIAAWARLLNSKQKAGLLIIDYDQKVDLKLQGQQSEWKALQKLIESFEELSKELKLYCLVLGQTNRDGLISGSHRSQFPAHTVLAFYEHEIHGPVIEAKKNRHGKKNQALTVRYDETTSQIYEGEVITLNKKPKDEKHKLMPKAPGDKWWASQ